MARITFTVQSPRPPADVLAALTDFSPRRLELWPAIDPDVYQVNEVGPHWADVVEGSAVMGGIRARERYDWSTPGVVRATIQESNLWHAGGMWELTARAGDDGGSVLDVIRDRTAKNLRGRVLEAMLRIAGRKMLASELAAAPAVAGTADSTTGG